MGGGARGAAGAAELWLRGEATRQPQRRSPHARLRAARDRSTSGSTASCARAPAFSLNITADRTPLLRHRAVSMDDALDGPGDAELFDRRGARRFPRGMTAAACTLARHRADRRPRLHGLERQRHPGSRRERRSRTFRFASPRSARSRRGATGSSPFSNVPTGPQQVGLDTARCPSTSIRRRSAWWTSSSIAARPGACRSG